jgi:Hsp20/alpha crystallin family
MPIASFGTGIKRRAPSDQGEIDDKSFIKIKGILVSACAGLTFTMNRVMVSFILPGLQKEDVRIDVHNDVLAVSGETRSASERSEEGYCIQ